ncbi:MAG: hypothetical protein ACKVJU_09520 [Verrucomicrobiales bacterium]
MATFRKVTSFDPAWLSKPDWAIPEMAAVTTHKSFVTQKSL